jgi:anthranilate/para-aminobenzoate synthase component I
MAPTLEIEIQSDRLLVSTVRASEPHAEPLLRVELDRNDVGQVAATSAVRVADGPCSAGCS